MSWDEDPTIKKWLEHCATELGPKIESTAVGIAIVPPSMDDPKVWVEIGAMICLDKPIILVAFDDRQIPPKLRSVADEVVLIPDGVNIEASEELAAALKRWVPDLG